MTNGSAVRVVGYACALGAGILWGTTGPLSTALYAEGAALTGIGFWRIALATVGFLVAGLFYRELFRIDRRSLLVVTLGGGALVATFEVAYQFAIAGAGVAGAGALLYTAPVMVALLSHPLLSERLTAVKLTLAIVVTTGAVLTVRGGSTEGVLLTDAPNLGAGVAGGLLAALSYAGTTMLARRMVPRVGAVKFLFYEIAGGTVLLALILPLFGQTPAPVPTVGGWVYVLALALGTVLAANFLFFAAVRRIEAAPTSVAATIEPAVGALLALVLFNQQLSFFGWLGLALVVSGVGAGYAKQAREANAATPVGRTGT